MNLKQQRGQRHGEAPRALRTCRQRLEVCRRQLAPGGDRLAFHCSNTGFLALGAAEIRAEGTQTHLTQRLDVAPMHAHPDDAGDTRSGRVRHMCSLIPTEHCATLTAPLRIVAHQLTQSGITDRQCAGPLMRGYAPCTIHRASGLPRGLRALCTCHGALRTA